MFCGIVPVIVSTTPSYASLVSGSVVTIIGNDLGVNDIVDVKLATAQIAAWTWISATRIDVVIPPLSGQLAGSVFISSALYGTGSGGSFSFSIVRDSVVSQ